MIREIIILIIVAISVEHCDWPMFRCNPEGTSLTECPLSEDLDMLWKYSLPVHYHPSHMTSGFEEYIPPCVSKGRLYFAVDGILHCLQTDNGELLFEIPVSEIQDVSTYCAAAGEKIFICAHDFMCINTHTRKKEWTIDEGYLVYSVPLIEDNTIFLPLYIKYEKELLFIDIPPPPLGYWWNTILCIDITTGTVKWRVSPQENKLRIRITSPPVIGEDRLYFTGHENGLDDILYCIEIGSGVILWKKDLHVWGTVPYYYQGSLYYCSSSTLTRVDPDTGFTLWTKELPLYSPYFSIGYDKLFMRNDTGIFSMDSNTGEILWETSLPDHVSMPALTDGKVITGSQDGNLYILNAQNGEILQKIFVGEELFTPVVADGTIFVESRYSVYAFGKPQFYNEYYCVIIGIFFSAFVILHLVKKRIHQL
ncbi:MAG: PQQ-like beta-propeller repeat protein [Theionarchaea archaeon]|nr:PQQ-like beta-propeller repeat protein [Theionarchaea archaeon]